MQITETLPQLKEVKPIYFLYFRTETTVDQLFNFISVAKDLFKEAVSLNIHITGPVSWHYFGFTGDGSKPFTLEIALPVGEIVEEYDGNFHFKRSDQFKCVSIIHEGSWLDIPQAYNVLMQFMEENKLQPTGVNREIYLNADFIDEGSNVTEVQIGIHS